MNLTENAPPHPGNTYAINKKGSDSVVTINGTNVAIRHWEGLETQKWECVEKNGWLGFVSHASTIHNRGAYLGHDGNGGLICSVPHHDSWEYFQVVLHDEGFALEIRNDVDDNRISFIGITAGGNGLKLLPKGTTWWGFTVIDGATGGQPSHAPSTRSLSIDAPQMKLVVRW
jgi:hypothetical protein